MTWDSHRDALSRVRLLSLDVDGVLTDGRLRYGAEGEIIKVFHAHDGLGLKLLMGEGIEVAIITAKTGAPLRKRLDDLGVTHAFMGREDKRAAFEELVAELGVAPAEVAHVGDDLPDLAVMRRVGVSIAVANAVAKVRAEAMLITERSGGDGAVREVCERILEARGTLDAAIERYLRSENP